MVTATSANMNIADYCGAMGRNEIIVNRDYQRSDKVWPVSAKSYLIESIILGYPIPKFYLYSVADAKNRRTIKEIVDGQQRSKAIQEFLRDGFALSDSLDTVELRGLTYSTLDDYQGPLLSYILSIDQFVNASPSEVRQVFRRMNSYTVPLNPEELRHADNQGKFKWFINRLGEGYSDGLLSLGVFRDKDVVRMQDLKLLTEIAYGLEYGVTTTAKASLDKIYKVFDLSFPNEGTLESNFHYALGIVVSMRFLNGTSLAKSYQIYSLAIALALEWLEYRSQNNNTNPTLDMAAIERDMMEMSAAIDLGAEGVRDPELKAFVLASADRTNVKDQRNRRITTFRNVIKSASR